MKRRKTIEVDRLVDMVNQRNRQSICSQETRDGWNSFLESVLMETGNYKGFMYLDKHHVPAGEDPGIADDNTIIDNSRIVF